MVTPRIVPRAEHSISRRDIDPDALKVLNRLRQFNHVAYLVGGSVRDLLLNRRPKDFDIGTSAHPHQVKKLFRNCWIIGRRFRLAHVKFGTQTIEVATFRRQVDSTELTAEAEIAEALEAGADRPGGDTVQSTEPDEERTYADEATPESQLLQRADAESLRRAIETLPSEFREVLLMSDVEEMSYREIAQTLSIPIGTVTSRLIRARQKVRKALSGES